MQDSPTEAKAAQHRRPIRGGRCGMTRTRKLLGYGPAGVFAYAALKPLVRLLAIVTTTAVNTAFITLILAFICFGYWWRNPQDPGIVRALKLDGAFLIG